MSRKACWREFSMTSDGMHDGCCKRLITVACKFNSMPSARCAWLAHSSKGIVLSLHQLLFVVSQLLQPAQVLMWVRDRYCTLAFCLTIFEMQSDASVSSCTCIRQAVNPPEYNTIIDPRGSTMLVTQQNQQSDLMASV